MSRTSPALVRSVNAWLRKGSSPSRRSGVAAMIRSPIMSSVLRVIRDGKKPGAIALTVMP